MWELTSSLVIASALVRPPTHERSGHLTNSIALTSRDYTILPLPVNISYNPKMTTLSDRFQRAVDELRSKSANSAEHIEAIILLSKSHGIDGIAVAPGTDDYTESLRSALRWGLRKYGLDLYHGHGFFAALAHLGRILPHTWVSNPSPLQYCSKQSLNYYHVASEV